MSEPITADFSVCSVLKTFYEYTVLLHTFKGNIAITHVLWISSFTKNVGLFIKRLHIQIKLQSHKEEVLFEDLSLLLLFLWVNRRRITLNFE